QVHGVGQARLLDVLQEISRTLVERQQEARDYLGRNAAMRLQSFPPLRRWRPARAHSSSWRQARESRRVRAEMSRLRLRRFLRSAELARLQSACGREVPSVRIRGRGRIQNPAP